MKRKKVPSSFCFFRSLVVVVHDGFTIRRIDTTKVPHTFSYTSTKRETDNPTADRETVIGE